MTEAGRLSGRPVECHCGLDKGSSNGDGERRRDLGSVSEGGMDRSLSWIEV